MLDLGFLPEVERVLKSIPGARQTALFTATMPKKVALLAHQYMSHPREIEVGRQTPESAEHYRVEVQSQHKVQALVALIEKEQPRSGLIFTRTREGSQRLALDLLDHDVIAVAFHGDLNQAQRERIVENLKAGKTTLVVATDVAARGLDIPLITHVINFDVPEEAEQYVHRAGRTARAGKGGRVFTLVTENDGAHAQAAERAAKLSMKPYVLSFEVGGEVVETGEERRVEAKRGMAGGNARGALKRNKPTPPNPVGKLLKDPSERPPPLEDRFDLPPSRRKRRDE